MEDKKKKFLIIGISIITIIVVLIGVSFAFYQLQSNIGGTRVNLKSDQLDTLTFAQGTKLALSLNQESLAEGAGNVVGETYGTANLKADVTTKTASDTYHVYFRVNSNDFIYTTEAQTPELLLQIFDPTGTEITELEGLTYTTVGDVSGFDVTTYNGIVHVAENYAISTTNTTSGETHKWTAKVTAINLDTDQIANETHKLDAEIVVQADYVKYPLVPVLLAAEGGTSAITAKGTPDFSAVVTTDDGMYADVDDDGTTYYYRGAVDNNYVKFADEYWRIIRINGDGSVRMIYQGGYPDDTGTSAALTNTTSFNGTRTNNMYVGYMYTSGEVHGLGTESNVKTSLDSWYDVGIEPYEDYIDFDAGFCGDRSNYTNASGTTSGGGSGTTTTYYGGYVRIYTNDQPSFLCPNEEDLYTVASSSKGNKALTVPMGLITADEVYYAGGFYAAANSGYYLYTGANYWTMTPLRFSSSVYARVAIVDSNGDLNYSYVTTTGYGVRPVINLVSDVTYIKGDGSQSTPYEIY